MRARGGEGRGRPSPSLPSTSSVVRASAKSIFFPPLADDVLAPAGGTPERARLLPSPGARCVPPVLRTLRTARTPRKSRRFPSERPAGQPTGVSGATITIHCPSCCGDTSERPPLGRSSGMPPVGPVRQVPPGKRIVLTNVRPSPAPADLAPSSRETRPRRSLCARGARVGTDSALERVRNRNPDARANHASVCLVIRLPRAGEAADTRFFGSHANQST